MLASSLKRTEQIIKANFLYNSKSFVHNNLMTKSEALEKARVLAKGENWPWEEPISVSQETTWGKIIWVVKTNCDNRGRNVIIRIADDTGEIITKNFALR